MVYGTEQHFLRTDVVGTLLGVLLLAPFLFATGYAFAWISNIRNFRQESLIWRILWALPLSIGIAPILGFLIWNYAGLTAASIFFGACSLLTLLRLSGNFEKPPRWLVVTFGIWLAITVVSGVDVPWGDRLYPSVLVYDHHLRTSLIDGISRNGLPAVSSLFHPAEAVPLRYHYLWFIPISLAEQLGGSLVTSRHALLASSVWCGWSLTALSLLFLRYVRGRSDAFGRLGLMTTILLAAAGLDIIPVAFGAAIYYLTGKGWMLPTIEWWNSQIAGLPDSVLWVPHNIASMIACCTAFTLLWRQAGFAAIILAAICIASAPGLAVYVTLAFAAAIAVYLCSAIYERDWSTVRAWALAGGGAILMSLPFLAVLLGAKSGGGQLFRFEVRQFVLAEGIMQAFERPPFERAIANLLALPLNYFLEAGIVAAIAVIFSRRYLRDGRGRAIFILIAVPMLVATFLRSGVITNNDLGWRAPLLAQFAAIVWFSSPLAAILRQKRNWIHVVLALGLLSTIWDLVIMRIYFPLSDHELAPQAKWFLDPDPGRRAFDFRFLYESIAGLTPATAVIQGNPNVWCQVFLGAYSLRQAGSFEYECGAAMGGDPVKCKAMQEQLLPIFNDPTKSESAQVDTVCRTWGIDALVVASGDPIWGSRPHWLTSRTPLVKTPLSLAVPCGGALPSDAGISTVRPLVLPIGQ